MIDLQSMRQILLGEASPVVNSEPLVRGKLRQTILDWLKETKKKKITVAELTRHMASTGYPGLYHNTNGGNALRGLEKLGYLKKTKQGVWVVK